jgi:hypothetical protein
LIRLTGAPLARQDATMPYQQLMMAVYGCAELSGPECHRAEKDPGGQLRRPAFGLERSRLVNAPFTRSGWQAVLSAFDAGRAAGHFRQLEVHAFGGVANTLSRGATAYVHRDALFCVNYRDTIADPAVADTAGRSAAQSWVDSGFGTIDPYSSGESYQNWIDPDLPDWKQAYYAENYPRLVRVKRAYDPSSFFTFNQGIGS